MITGPQLGLYTMLTMKLFEKHEFQVPNPPYKWLVNKIK